MQDLKQALNKIETDLLTELKHEIWQQTQYSIMERRKMIRLALALFTD